MKQFIVVKNKKGVDFVDPVSKVYRREDGLIMVQQEEPYGNLYAYPADTEYVILDCDFIDGEYIYQDKTKAKELELL